jgi:hypothetical protein
MLVVPDNGVSRTWISQAGSGPSASITTLPSSDGSAWRSTLEPRSVSRATMKSAACSADIPTASDALTGPSRVSVGTASGGSGNEGGRASQIRPHSASVWVVGTPAGGGVATVEPPGTGVRLGSVEGLALAGVVGRTDGDDEQPEAIKQIAARMERSVMLVARRGDRWDRETTTES